MNSGTATTRLRVRLLAASAAVLLALGACSSADDAADDTTKVTIAMPAPSELFNLPAVLADQLGYYAEEGLDVQIVDFKSGSGVLQAVLAGDAQVASGFHGNTLTMAAKGKPFRSFVTTVNSPSVVLVASPKTKRNIASVADLKGAVVGVSAPGSGTHHLLNFLLTKNGVSTQDVSVAGIGLAATAVAAMERGTVDAAVMAEPALSQLAKRAGPLTVLTDTREPSTIADLFGTTTYPGFGLYSRTEWQVENPDTVTRMARAVTRTLTWIHSHSAEEIAAAMPSEYAAGDLALYVKTIAAALPTISTDGRMDAAGAAAVRVVLDGSVPEIAAADIDLNTTFTNEYL